MLLGVWKCREVAILILFAPFSWWHVGLTPKFHCCLRRPHGNKKKLFLNHTLVHGWFSWNGLISFLPSCCFKRADTAPAEVRAAFSMINQPWKPLLRERAASGFDPCLPPPSLFFYLGQTEHCRLFTSHLASSHHPRWEPVLRENCLVLNSTNRNRLPAPTANNVCRVQMFI